MPFLISEGYADRPIGKARIINKMMPEFNRDENLIRPVQNVLGKYNPLGVI